MVYNLFSVYALYSYALICSRWHRTRRLKTGARTLQIHRTRCLTHSTHKLHCLLRSCGRAQKTTASVSPLQSVLQAVLVSFLTHPVCSWMARELAEISDVMAGHSGSFDVGEIRLLWGACQYFCLLSEPDRKYRRLGLRPGFQSMASAYLRHSVHLESRRSYDIRHNEEYLRSSMDALSGRRLRRRRYRQVVHACLETRVYRIHIRLGQVTQRATCWQRAHRGTSGYATPIGLGGTHHSHTGEHCAIGATSPSRGYGLCRWRHLVSMIDSSFLADIKSRLFAILLLRVMCWGHRANKSVGCFYSQS